MNLEKFKSLSFKEKVSWIWEYYAVTIVVTIVAIVVGILLITSMLGVREGQKVELNVLVLDDRMDQNAADRLNTELASIITGNIELSFYSKSNMEQFQAFVVRTAVDGPDIVIAPLNEMTQLAENGYVNSNYVKLDEASFYADALGMSDTFNKYEDVYISMTVRGSNPENSELVLERYKLNE